MKTKKKTQAEHKSKVKTHFSAVHLVFFVVFLHTYMRKAKSEKIHKSTFHIYDFFQKMMGFLLVFKKLKK